MSTTMRWALSMSDWRWHAIDELEDHPVGVFTAQCGHLLPGNTTLREMFNGAPCEPCALKQLAALPLKKFSATCRRAGPDDPPADLTLPTHNRRPAPG